MYITAYPDYMHYNSLDKYPKYDEILSNLFIINRNYKNYRTLLFEYLHRVKIIPIRKKVWCYYINDFIYINMFPIGAKSILKLNDSVEYFPPITDPEEILKLSKEGYSFETY